MEDEVRKAYEESFQRQLEGSGFKVKEVKMIKLNDGGADAGKKARAEQRSNGAFDCEAGCGSLGSKRCTGCYIAYFCSDACFKETWSAHKSYCKETRAQYKTVRVTVPQACMLNPSTGQVEPFARPANLPFNLTSHPLTKKHFKVKVQLTPWATLQGELFVKNEEGSVSGGLRRAYAPQVSHTSN